MKKEKKREKLIAQYILCNIEKLGWIVARNRNLFTPAVNETNILARKYFSRFEVSHLINVF